MAEFDDVRYQLRQSRSILDDTENQRFLADQRVRDLAAQRVRLERGFDPADPERVAERNRLDRELAAARAELDRLTKARDVARATEAELTAQFAAFTDPREGITRLADDTPLLLMPVRLETRFVPAGAGEARPELWVRVYPDDCWIDTFDPLPTETELADTRDYWIGYWQAGGVPEQERAAWRMLAGGHGSGRAAWLVASYRPDNLADRPDKADPDDVILTIAVRTALPTAEAEATAAYWRAVWLAAGAAAGTERARRELVAAVGAERAAEIVATLRPANFDVPPPAGDDGGEATVSVSFVVLPAMPTRRSSWSRPARVTVMPDRFVFVGYSGTGEPLVHLGAPVPDQLLVGPDPSATGDDQLHLDEAGELVVPAELRWLSDFPRAVEVGMGLRVPLTEVQARDGFDRVFVIGLRLSADPNARDELTTLLTHHRFTGSGISLVPQGTPTNNTDQARSGHGRDDDPDASFDDLATPRFEVTGDRRERRDGQWLAQYLGVDPDLFVHVRHAGGTDRRAGTAMNDALWPATLGYWQETMMAPVFPADAIAGTRRFFTEQVLGAGAVPAIRIGSQPYGILPATAFSRMDWFDPPNDDGDGDGGGDGGDGDGDRDGGSGPVPRATIDESESAFLRRLYQLLRAIQEDWRELLPGISYVGKAGDPHQLLLDVVGLHPGSVEWSQRYSESLRTLFNRLQLQGLTGFIQRILITRNRIAARELLTGLGYPGDRFPPILDQVFGRGHNRLTGGVVDDRPLSGTDPVRAYTTDGRNYLNWLADTAGVSLDALYQQDGFVDDTAPAALLYLMLRHALQLGYQEVGVGLHLAAGLYTPAEALLARSDDPFPHIRADARPTESRYRSLYAVEPRITGDPGITVGRFIGARLASLELAAGVRNQVAAVRRLADEPTARLERAFADHVDCCGYRLDAWLLGLVHRQLDAMRETPRTRNGRPPPGVHLGGYAWLTDLRPDPRQLEPVPLDDPDLVADFGGPDRPPLLRDSTNQGYVHAPSPNHAVTAAVLRNGYLSNASPENRSALAVNLTSARVRTALGMLDGIRTGQGLADLLGYQFERGLHDRHGMAEVDRFIYRLRKAFPLRADRMASTRTAPGVPIEAIEARNVLDGLALVRQLKQLGSPDWPFGRSELPPATPEQAAALRAEAERLLDTHDAVADLALAEGVYQAVLGNYDRVASTYDAYAQGRFPPEPDVVRTPINGIGLTCRVALHLPAVPDPPVSPVPGVPLTPRGRAEPAVNAWLATVLPPLNQVGCVVTFRSVGTGRVTTREVTLNRLGLQPADLLALIPDDTGPATPELDDRVTRYASSTFDPRPDVPVTIAYLRRLTAPYSVFELTPLLRQLRRLTTARPLRATDLALTEEARRDQDAAPALDPRRLLDVRDALADLRADLVTGRSRLADLLADPARREELLTGIDGHVADVAGLLARAATFAVPQTGWAFGYEFRRGAFAGLLRQAADLADRWADRLAEFDEAIDRYDTLPATMSDAERFRILTTAERAITLVPATPPADPDAWRTELVTVRRPAFVARRARFAALADTTIGTVSGLRAAVRALLPVTDVDPIGIDLAPVGQEMIRFAEDAVRIINVVLDAVDRRLAAARDAFDRHDATAVGTERVAALEQAAKALLGDDFVVVPEFTLGTARGAEVARALAAARSGTPFAHLTDPPDPATPPVDFPVDTWLHGLARVREPVAAWEQLVLLSPVFGRPEPALDALQFPVVPGDPWLGLEFPAGQRLDTERVLYTAHFAGPFDPAGRQRGLLLDEWSETIPGDDVDTGIALHHDRPNNEAPQAMLLVTPTRFRGAWQWADLVDALTDTLELARLRAVEPVHVDRLPYAPFLPATLVASQARQLTIAANLAFNNRIRLASLDAEAGRESSDGGT